MQSQGPSPETQDLPASGGAKVSRPAFRGRLDLVAPVLRDQSSAQPAVRSLEARTHATTGAAARTAKK
eukprot:4282736-Alexandrium_andersonii.AAC.1